MYLVNLNNVDSKPDDSDLPIRHGHLPQAGLGGRFGDRGGGGLGGHGIIVRSCTETYRTGESPQSSVQHIKGCIAKIK